MANNYNPTSEKIISLVKSLPYFKLDNLIGINDDRNYLYTVLSRYKKAGKFIRLKKGFYTTKEYIGNIVRKDELFSYPEFISMVLYQPSYLSLDYMLYEYNILTEIPNNFTSITKKTTAHFSNQFGNFFYHKIKDELFCGFEILKKGDFTIYKATKAKALFDFLYLRKYSIPNKEAAMELRLNLGSFGRADKKELDNYVEKEGSERMTAIMDYLFA